MIVDDDRDRALLAAHLAGDPDAFGVLVGIHRARLWAVAVRTMSTHASSTRAAAVDREEAADAVQDALLSAFRHAAGFRGEAQVSTWLHRIVVNACMDRVRRAAARPTVPLPTGDDAPADRRDALDESETAVLVHAGLARLPVEQRLAIVLVDLQGLPVEQAARVLGIPVGTVKSRCSRGRAQLAVFLGRLPGENGNAGNRGAAGPVAPLGASVVQPGPEGAP